MDQRKDLSYTDWCEVDGLDFETAIFRPVLGKPYTSALVVYEKRTRIQCRPSPNELRVLANALIKLAGAIENADQANRSQNCDGGHDMGARDC